MKTVFAAATGLALVATGAFANPSSSVLLKARVAEYLAITGEGDSQIYEVSVTDFNSHSHTPNDEDRATFSVRANVRYDITLDWTTWNDGSSDHAAYAHVDTGCLIGGDIDFVAESGPQRNDSPIDPPNGSAISNGPFQPGNRTYRIGADLDPSAAMNCEGDVAAEGDYQLPVNITVARASWN